MLYPLELELKTVVNLVKWKSNLGPSEEKPVLLTIEQSLQSLFHCLVTQQLYHDNTHIACSIVTIHNLVGFCLFIELYPLMIQDQPVPSSWVLAPSLRASFSSALAFH